MFRIMLLTGAVNNTPNKRKLHYYQLYRQLRATLKHKRLVMTVDCADLRGAEGN